MFDIRDVTFHPKDTYAKDQYNRIIDSGATSFTLPAIYQDDKFGYEGDASNKVRTVNLYPQALDLSMVALFDSVTISGKGETLKARIVSIGRRSSRLRTRLVCEVIQ